MYVLEKAAALRRSGGEHIKSGVHLSYWIDVAPNVDADDFAFASGDDIATKTMKIRDLREIAVALGEYDVVKANCHHAALAAYNACVVPAKQQSLPNAHHIKLAKGLALLGIDVGNSRSSASGSTSASVSTGSEEQFTISNNCESFDHSAALIGAQLSSWIYLPDSASVLNIVNTTSRELVVSLDSTVRRNLSPKESTSIADSELGADELTLWVHSPGLLGLISMRTRLLKTNISLRETRHYRLVSVDDKIECKRDEMPSPLPRGMTVRHIEKVTDGHLVQWAAVESADTVFVTFKGSDSAVDALIDAGASITRDDKPHGLRVASAIQTALERKGRRADTTLERMIRVVLESGKAKVVLCGHSLGGGYAILAALEMINLGHPVAAVLTFGAPQVVVPEVANPTWQRLNAITSLYVNSWDPVPRLPSCSEWLSDVLPKVATAMAPTMVAASMALAGAPKKIIDFLSKLGPALEGDMQAYDTVGTLYFVGSHKRSAMQVPYSDGASSGAAAAAVDAPLLGQRVVLDGLSSRPELNGRRGVAQSFEGGRYLVALEGGGERVRVRPDNLSPSGHRKFLEKQPESPGAVGLDQHACACYVLILDSIKR